MLRYLSLVLLFPVASWADGVPSLSQDRANAMLPFIAQDRERAMNDHALCSADLLLARKTIEDLQKQIADLKKPADDK